MKHDAHKNAARTGARCIVEGFERGGCEYLFGYPGGTVLDIFNEIVQAPFQFILARHEQGAVHMADGYARATGKVGCCVATSGPGACNTITGLATANMDSIPLVCVCGQVSLSAIGNDAFQEADVTGITRPITKHNYLVRNVDDIPGIMAEAFFIAQNGRPGPVVIDIPKDIQQKLTSVAPPVITTLRNYRQPAAPEEQKSFHDLLEALRTCKRPMILAGGGVISSGASDALRAFAAKANIPVATTLMGLGTFPEDDPLALRMAGMHGSATANFAINHCDLLISAAARFDDRVTSKIADFAPTATIAHIDCDYSTINKVIKTHIGIHGDVGRVLAALTQNIQPADRPDWLAQIASWRADHPFRYDHSKTAIQPQAVIETIQKICGGESVIVTDVGQHQMWSTQHLLYRHPRTFISSGGLGTMGFGLPAAIGAQLANPARPVICISGDGGIQMNFQELVVAVEHHLPVKVVVLNNGHLGMVRQWQELFYEHRYSAVVLGQHHRPKNEHIDGQTPAEYLPDFVKLAQAHGANALRLTAPADVEPALRAAFADDKTWLIECIVEPEANVFPMIPPGRSVREMIFNA